VCRTCFLNGLLLFEGGPVDIFCWIHGNRSGGPLPICCGHDGQRLESTSHTLNSRNSSNNHTPTPETALNRTYGNELLIPCQTVEDDWINVTRLDRVTSDSWFCFGMGLSEIYSIEFHPITKCGLWLPIVNAPGKPSGNSPRALYHLVLFISKCVL